MSPGDGRHRMDAVVDGREEDGGGVRRRGLSREGGGDRRGSNLLNYFRLPSGIMHSFKF